MTVKLKEITKIFDETIACNNICITVKENSFYFLLGPSGCGKTTLLKIIAGLLKQDSGSIYLDGNSIDDLPAFKRDINTVFQNYALFPHLSVFDNIAFGLKMKKLPKNEITEKVKKIIDQVELAGLEKRKPHQLSGGQQQRVALGRALVNEPSVLLLDEPLAALDAKLRKQMQIELKQLQIKLNKTFVYVTHDQEEALIMADRIAIMNDGKIEQIGTPDEIYNFPKTRFVADFIGESNFIKGVVSKIVDSKAEVLIGSNNVIAAAFKNEKPSINNEVSCFVRPEKIKISKLKQGKSDSINQLEGIIAKIIFKGDINFFEVKIDENISIKVTEQNYQLSSSFKVNEKVNLNWEIDNTLIID